MRVRQDEQSPHRRQVAERPNFDDVRSSEDANRFARHVTRYARTVDPDLGRGHGRLQLDPTEMVLDDAERLLERGSILRDPRIVFGLDGRADVAFGLDPLPDRLLGETEVSLNSRSWSDGGRSSEKFERLRVLVNAPQRDPLGRQRLRIGRLCPGRRDSGCGDGEGERRAQAPPSRRLSPGSASTISDEEAAEIAPVHA